jgi:hypothetical protein
VDIHVGIIQAKFRRHFVRQKSTTLSPEGNELIGESPRAVGFLGSQVDVAALAEAGGGQILGSVTAEFWDRKREFGHDQGSIKQYIRTE